MERAVWLAGERGSWSRTLRRDPSGGSGGYVGRELDLRAAFQLTRGLAIEAVYARFFPGSFAGDTGASPASGFAYVGSTLRF